jgi:hypothetical protein
MFFFLTADGHAKAAEFEASQTRQAQILRALKLVPGLTLGGLRSRGIADYANGVMLVDALDFLCDYKWLVAAERAISVTLKSRLRPEYRTHYASSQAKKRARSTAGKELVELAYARPGLTALQLFSALQWPASARNEFLLDALIAGEQPAILVGV